MDGHAGQVDVVQQLVVELHRHAGGEEHHHLLVPVLLQEGEEKEEALVTGTHHIPDGGLDEWQDSHNGEELNESLTLALALPQWPYHWYPVKTEHKMDSSLLETGLTKHTFHEQGWQRLVLSSNSICCESIKRTPQRPAQIYSYPNKVPGKKSLIPAFR